MVIHNIRRTLACSEYVLQHRVCVCFFTLSFPHYLYIAAGKCPALRWGSVRGMSNRSPYPTPENIVSCWVDSTTSLCGGEIGTDGKTETPGFRENGKSQQKTQAWTI